MLMVMTDENVETLKKNIVENRGNLIREVTKDVAFHEWKICKEIRSETAKFWQKETSSTFKG